MSKVASNAAFHALSRYVAAVVAAALVLSTLVLPASAQSVLPTGPAGTQHLIITILEGEGALNNIRQRDAREPVVQVTDENHKPVSGVALLFLIHGGKSGASATFGENSLSFSTTTDAQGIAHAAGLHLGSHPGTITISVTATVGTMVVATTIIHQSNVITALGSTSTSASSSSAGTSSSSTSTGGASTSGTSTSGASTSSSTAGSSTAGGTTTGGTTSAGTSVAHHGILHFLSPRFIVGGVVVAGAVVGVVVAAKSSSSTDITLGGTTVGHP